MKTIKIKEPNRLVLDEAKEPSIQEADQVKVLVKRMGICGSDMHIYHGENPFATYPRIIGHEISGEIQEVGNKVTNVKPGDPVVLEPMVACGECYACRNNRPNVCEKVEVFGVHRDGGGQSMLIANEDLVHKMDSRLSWSEMALVEPFTIGAQSVYRGAVKPGDVVFVIGAGPIGLCCLKMAKREGAKVIISDFNQHRLDFAEKWGPDEVINPEAQDVQQSIWEITNQMGANVVIDAVGLPSTFEQAINVTSVAGRVVLLGFNSEASAITQAPITKKELSIHGSRLQTHRFPKVVDIFNNLNLDVQDLVSHEFTLDNVQEAFHLIENSPGDVRKVMIKM